MTLKEGAVYVASATAAYILPHVVLRILNKYLPAPMNGAGTLRRVTMEKAYELKALGQKIKEKAALRGLSLAEETIEVLAIAAYEGTKEWIQESAALSETKIDDVIAPFLGHLDGFLKPQIEKLDLDGDGK